MAKVNSIAVGGVVEVSDTDNTKVKASEYSAIHGDAPGTSVLTDVNIEGLGNLNDIPEYDPAKDEEGVGEFCVVLSHSHTGAKGEGFRRGDVRRLSKLVIGFDNPKRKDDVKKRDIYRLFSIGAIRLADKAESELTHVELPLAEDSKELKDERAMRIKLERENDALTQKLEALQGTAPEAPDTFE